MAHATAWRAESRLTCKFEEIRPVPMPKRSQECLARISHRRGLVFGDLTMIGQ